jgi:hypothetical protein
MLITASNVVGVEHQPCVASCSGIDPFYWAVHKDHKHPMICIVPNMFRTLQNVILTDFPYSSMFAFVTQVDAKRRRYNVAPLYNAFETKNSFDKFSLLFGMKPYRFVHLKSAVETLQSSHLTTPQVLFIPVQAVSKCYELSCCVGRLLNRQGLCVGMLVIVNCEISYSRAGPGVA